MQFYPTDTALNLSDSQRVATLPETQAGPPHHLKGKMMWLYTETLAWLATDQGAYVLAFLLAGLTACNVNGRAVAVLTMVVCLMLMAS